MKDVPEPDLEKLGGKLLQRHGQKRVLDLPPNKSKELRKHRSVMVLQRVWMGEALEELAEESETSGAAAVESQSDSGLAWGPKTYTYDQSGNIKSIASDSYAYDTAGRLIQATVGGKTEQYEYDAYGNLIRKTLAGAPSVTIPVDPSTNRLIGMEYDEAGNVLRRDSDVVMTGRYSYDAFNMLSGFSRTARWYVYDASDERIGMVTEEHSEWTIRDFEGRVLREYEGDPEFDEQTWVWQQDYVYAGNQLLGGERMEWGYLSNRLGGPRHYHLDHLGSVRLVTDDHARAVSENDYYPYGTTSTKSFQEQLNFAHFVDGARFAGHHRDFLAWTSFETDEYLDNMHARSYDPKMGRFLSVDPGRDWDPQQPQSWNLYTYVRNNPMLLTDPSGRNAVMTCEGNNQCVVNATVQVVYAANDQAAATAASNFKQNAEAYWSQQQVTGPNGEQVTFNVTANPVEAGPAVDRTQDSITAVNGSGRSNVKITTALPGRTDNPPDYGLLFTTDNTNNPSGHTGIDPHEMGHFFGLEDMPRPTNWGTRDRSNDIMQFAQPGNAPLGAGTELFSPANRNIVIVPTYVFNWLH